MWILNGIWSTARSQKLASYADILRALSGAECPQENSLRVAAIPPPPTPLRQRKNGDRELSE